MDIYLRDVHSISTQQDTLGQSKGADTLELGVGQTEEFCLICVTLALGVDIMLAPDGEGLTWWDALICVKFSLDAYMLAPDGEGLMCGDGDMLRYSMEDVAYTVVKKCKCE